MALNHTSIKSSLIAKLDSLTFDHETTDEEAKQQYADVIATWVIETITSAQVSVPALGLVAPNGPVTGSATGTIS